MQTAFKTHGFNLVGRGEGAKELAGYRTFRPSVESVFGIALFFGGANCSNLRFCTARKNNCNSTVYG